MCLREWENFLRPFLSKVELLGEIPLEQMQHAELEQDLANFVQSRGLTLATRCLKKDYPAAFVIYLAFKAAFNEERGFWDKVAEAIRAPSSQALFHSNHHWGQTFIDILEAYPNLRRFSGVSGFEYVTSIRLHGGIPAFSLPDFFRYILLPSVEKAPYDGYSDEQALGGLLTRYTAQLFVDDVVRHFFQFGGEPARKFFYKCRRMARLAATGKPLPSPDELGLRPYVVQVFESFQEKSAEPGIRRRRPRLYFDPYTPGFRITLPPQPLDLEQASQRHSGRLCHTETGKSYAEEISVRVRRQGLIWVTEELEWLLEEPLEHVQVCLFSQGSSEPIISYNLRLLPSPGYPPLLAFRYEDGALCSLSPALPAQSLWLFYPANVELRIEGQARQIEALHPFSPPWHDWQAGAWDLEKARLLRLICYGGDLCLPIAVSHVIKPALASSNLPLQITEVDEKPLYAAPPQLRLPLHDPQNPYPELSDWSLHFESRCAAQPSGTWEGKAIDLPCQVLVQESCALLSLDPWLGKAPFGIYNLALSYRGRPSLELPFQVCTGLQIQGLQPYYLPENGGAQAVCFQVSLPPNSSLHSEAPEIEIGKNGHVTVHGQTTQAELTIEIRAQPEAIKIPLRISIPRLRWALLLQPGSAVEWQYHPLVRPLAELLQADLARFRPRLRVELSYSGEEQPLVTLHLKTPGREKAWQTSDSRSLALRCTEFDLSEFFDTLRACASESIFEFHLEFLDAAHELEVELTVLRLSRELEIRACYFEARPGGDWRLHWYEPRPLCHRRLRLWSLWQPWADPAEILLPNDPAPSDGAPVEGWWMYDIPDEFGLPFSAYRAHFVAIAPYEHGHPPPFPPDNALSIETITADDRLKQINQQLENVSPKRAFALHFEKLCIYYSKKQVLLMEEEVRWCLSHWQDASLIHLESLARWLGKYDSRENQRAFLLHLFRPEKLQELRRQPPEFIRKCLANVPKMHSIRLESARLILEMASEPEVILHTLQSLVQSHEERAKSYFWEALQQGRFSEADAAQVIVKQPDFAHRLLQDAPASPWRARLLYALGRYQDLPEWVVKRSYYILFDAGWGKILEIQGANSSNMFLREEEKPILVVELLHWPGQYVKIDLARQEMELKDVIGAIFCGCGRFAVLGGKRTEIMRAQHQQLCGYTSVWLTFPAKKALLHNIYYSVQMPTNPLDTQAPS